MKTRNTYNLAATGYINYLCFAWLNSWIFAILNYFAAQGEILESHVTIGKNTCSDVGIYEFSMGATGKKVKGRYSFVYVWEDGQWKINHHHSSIMPEGRHDRHLVLVC